MNTQESNQANYEINDSSSSDKFMIETIEIKTVDNESVHKNQDIKSSLSTEWSIVLPTNGLDVKFKIDTGAQCNVIPKSVYIKLLNQPKLKKTSTNLTAYNNSEISVCGKCIVTLDHNEKSYKVLFIVVNSDAPLILGLKTSERLNLIRNLCTVNACHQPPIS